MTGGLDDLYQELILEHSRKPHNHHALEGATHQAEGYNPLCGDRVKVQLRVGEDAIADAAFTGTGCAICTASASMLTEQLKGQSRDDAAALFERFHTLLTEDDAEPDVDVLGDLAALGGVRRFPMRVKCATLACHTAKAALEDRGEPVTTE
ncbi:MAG: Fe-S cluster assembly sulfur transfer protein SufU [Phycisphaeraceae bacterium]